MTTQTLDQPLAAASGALPTEATDPVGITVQYDPNTSSVTFVGPTDWPVIVCPNGTILIKWGTETSRELAFSLASEPLNVLFEGLQLTWSGSQRDATHPLQYAASCDADQMQRRTLRLTLSPSLEEFTYSLTLCHQGARHRVDPKIYNQGDGKPKK